MPWLLYKIEEVDYTLCMKNRDVPTIMAPGTEKTAI